MPSRGTRSAENFLSLNSLCVPEAVPGRRWLTMRLNAFTGCAQRENILSLNSLCVREAVSGRRWLTMRLNAFAGLSF